MIKTLKNIWTHFLNDSLYRNSLYLMASTIIISIFGFLFWVVNARIYSPSQIGIATTIISATSLITQFALFGLKNGIIRFLPKSQTKNYKINTGINIIALANVVICLIFLLFLPIFSQKLVFLRENPFFIILFIVFSTSFTLNQFQEGVLIAYRSTGFVVVKNLLWGAVKLITALLAGGLGAFGVFFAFSIGSIFSYLLGLAVLLTKFKFSFSPAIHTEVVKTIWKFSFGDYLGTFMAYVPQFFIPLLIINRIGTSESAYYYIDQQIIGLLYIIPIAVTQSLFAEGVHNEEELKKHISKTFLLVFSLMIPAILVTIFLGGFVLEVFGKVYAGNGVHFLQLLSLGGIGFSINSIGSILIRIKNKIHLYVIMNAVSAFVFIGASLILLKYQLLGIGFAYIFAQTATAIIYLLLLKRILE